MIHIRKTVSFIIAALLITTAAGSGSLAAETEIAKESDTASELSKEEEAGDFLIESDSSGNYKYEQGRLFIYGGTVCVKNSKEEATSDRIEISGNAEVILSGVNIEAMSGAAISVLPGADAEICLQSVQESEKTQEEEEEEQEIIIDNLLRGAEGYAGLEVGTLPGGEDMPSLSSNVRITGDGYLTAFGGEGGAGIGGSREQSGCGIITIEGGHITAAGGSGADGIGCGAESESEAVYLPRISANTASLAAFSDGTGNAIACKSTAAEEAELEGFTDAFILDAVFARADDGSLTGLAGVRVSAVNAEDETVFDMPEGARRFAVKTLYDSEYMIEQEGRIFGASEEEYYTGEVTDEDLDILFRPGAGSEDAPKYLVPLDHVPSTDIDVIGKWDDGDDLDGSRPDSVLVTLYANGKETGRTLTLSSENEWQGSFDDLPVYSDLTRQAYSVVEERIEGYMGAVSGSAQEGYTITNIHDPLPEGRTSEEEISKKTDEPLREGTIVATVVTTKVSRSMPVRTSTTIEKTRSAKTADSSDTILWGGMLLASVMALFIWMRFEQRRDRNQK